jgi:multidrug resistance efflux pump
MTEPSAPPAARQSRAALLAILGVAAALIALHLVTDRLTPHTNQARVTAYVVPIAPEVGGTVTAIHVANNARVKKGDPLYTLSAANYQTALEKARADLAATIREQQAQDAAISAAEANLRAAEAGLTRARQDLSRLQRIYAEDEGAISVRRLELSVASATQAEAQRDAARAQLSQAIAARGPRDAANDRLVAARTAVTRAELDVGRTIVRAPGNGLVTNLSIDVGQFAGPGAALMSFVSETDAWIAADFTENNLGNMNPGDRAHILLDVAPGRVFPGTVRSIGFGVSSGFQPLGPNPGALPSVSNSRDFLRPAQRFPVIVSFAPGTIPLGYLRQGGQADVIVETGDNPALNLLARISIRVRSWLAYAW